MKMYTITKSQIETVAKHYLVAALWADSAEGTNPKLCQATKDKAFKLCAAWLAENAALFHETMVRAENGYGMHPDCEFMPEGALGHDLWLTSQGHGVGFWGRGELRENELGDRLSKASKSLQGVYLEQYRGWVYLHEDITK